MAKRTKKTIISGVTRVAAGEGFPAGLHAGDGGDSEGKLLADRDAEAVIVSDGDDVTMPMGAAMARCGLTVVQDETFYVDVKKEDVA